MSTADENVSHAFHNKSVLVTGGTGSFGKKFVETFLARYPTLRRLVVFSRDELKQFEMKQRFSEEQYPQLRYFIGDVRDKARLEMACEDIDIIIHAAAMKQVDTAEYNPSECVATNVTGAENVISAALKHNVGDIVALSTDKACAPINLYGATKLVSDKLFTAANNIRGKRNSKFSVVRYGNVMGSRGSVIPFFLSLKDNNVLPITHKDMSRFNISLESGVELVIYALLNHLGGEIFIPKIPSYNIVTLAKAIAPSAQLKIIGIRPGEKLHEEMITSTDAINTIDIGEYYTILPAVSVNVPASEYIDHHKGKYVPEDFSYNSGDNEQWETEESLRSLIKQHVDRTFGELS